MNMRELIKEAENKRLKDVVFTHHIEDLRQLENYLPRPIGFIQKRCPLCKAKLNKRIGNDGRLIYRYFKCTKCDYEYVKTTVA